MQRETPLWVYKCNARNEAYQTDYGNWEDFFREPGDGRWGGTESTRNPGSLDIIRNRLQPIQYAARRRTRRS